ncbi:MAG: NAD(P)H-hydrate dehydratase [Thermodesulfobacteriota bacterium]
MQLASAEEMRAIDRATIEEMGLPGVVLMENAGRQTVAAMGRLFDPLAGKRVSLVIGPGNNGGDGLVIARLLQQQGCRPEVELLVPGERLTGDAGTNLAIVEGLPVPIRLVLGEEAIPALAERLGRSDLVVDAIFGTGLTRHVGGHFAAAIEAMNSCGRPVVAVDIPSGLDADSGQPLGVAVRATLTVTFGLAKPGLVVTPGCLLAGRLEVADIGLLREAVAAVGPRRRLLDEPWAGSLVPARPEDGHKGTFGHLLVVAGSQGHTGAALLAGLGGLRAGAGLVSLAVPSFLNPIFETRLLEAMTVPLPAAGGGLAAEALPEIRAALTGKSALVIGPGLGTGPAIRLLLAGLLEDLALPVVLDADALTILAQERSLLDGLARLAGRVVLTPHPGEMGRLTGTSAKAVQGARIAQAEALARRHGVVLALKGSRTLIAGPEGDLAVCPAGNPGMACGGMGDVLAGIIGGLLAQGVPSWQAACLGVYAHGLAGDRLARRLGGHRGLLASELADELPGVLEGLATAADQLRPTPT